ncbi:MAG: CBS domain-containing protein [Gammaproteobacteria bacterium]|nr:CBS domain-containing protein [Gammaproteobacteria bacterium]MDH5305055.1 CBS domain-containing protein [Gammaproteobacteria bacterium]MDH5322833.1 CBS domain-containing protein [Gammaproteobacteria bacterium]
MKLIKHLLDRKGRQIISIKPDASVLDAIRLMAEKNIGAVLVMKNNRLLGIMSERDYARKVVVKGRASDTTPVSDIMTSNVVSTTSSETVDTCMTLMTDKRIRHLPVVDDNVVVGVISIGDLVHAIIADQQEAIEQLEQYISG